MNMLTSLAIAGIRFYKNFISPAWPLVLSSGLWGCRFHPSCSDYALKAVRQYGLKAGFMFSLKRLFRCHPFSIGGWDPLP